MNTTTLIILNGIAALGLLAGLALVMFAAHRAAGSAGAELVRVAREEPELERAA